MKVNIGKYQNKGDRNIKVNVDNFDIWNLDHTLALIIHPTLVFLRQSPRGAPKVDDQDVPEHIKSTSAKPKENDWDTDEFWFDRWNYVLDQMIWSFNSIIGDEPRFFENGVFDRNSHDIWYEKQQNGLNLFAKYYRSLWT